MILGIDVSSSITGYAIIDDGELVMYDSINTKKKKDLFWCAEQNRELLERIKEEYNIKHIYIEENLQSFRSGFSSAHTISILSKMNGLITYISQKIFGIKPEFVSARTARSELGIDCGKKAKKRMQDRLLIEGKSKSYSKTMSTKMIVHEYIQETEPTFEFKITRSDNPKPRSFDRADAIVVARYAEKILGLK